LRNFFLFFLIFLALTACAPQEAPQAAPADAPQDTVFCTADVQECPDGSFVSRVAPDCAFKPCP
jgi:hypothetical protein